MNPRWPIVLAVLVGCRERAAPAPTPAATIGSARRPEPPAPTVPQVSPRFEDITKASGVTFVHENGEGHGKRWPPETFGSGVAIFDADGDGWLDLYLVQGRPWDRPKEGVGRLFRSKGAQGGALAFEDITEKAGLAVPLYGMGAAAADVNGDGRIDLLVTALDDVRLFLNQGEGRFVDATRGAGLPGRGWWTSAAFLDHDQDGDLDLFLARYYDWSPATDVRCELGTDEKTYCGPERYRPTQSVLLAGDGAGHFTDVSREAGLAEKAEDKALGVAVTDLNGDGYPDIAVANDMHPNRLWMNQGRGADGKVRFRDAGLASGMGVNWEGKARAGMGIAWTRLDGRGSWLAVGNFAHEMTALYATTDGVHFEDRAVWAGLGYETQLALTFGLLFVDLDADGWPELSLANGHVEPIIAKVQPSVTYAQPQMVFRGYPGGKFSRMSAADAGDLAPAAVGRGLAAGDLDRDGAVDLVLTINHGAPRVLLNRCGCGGRALRLRLSMDGKNRQAIGAVVTAKIGGQKQVREVSGGDSYLSSSDRELHFASASPGATVEEVSVRWPGGVTERVEGLALGRAYAVSPGAPARPLP